MLFSARISGDCLIKKYIVYVYALYTILSVICAMRIMSATHADTCINALMNTRDLSSGSTSEINMGGTQATYLVDSRSYGSARASLTA